MQDGSNAPCVRIVVGGVEVSPRAVDIELDCPDGHVWALGVVDGYGHPPLSLLRVTVAGCQPHEHDQRTYLQIDVSSFRIHRFWLSFISFFSHDTAAP